MNYKKIVFVTEYLDIIDGTARVITNWSNYFVKYGIDIENVCVRNGKPFFKLDERVKFTVFNFKFGYKLFKLFYLFFNTMQMYFFLKKRKNTNIIFNKSLYIEPVWILRKLGFFKTINLVYFCHGGTSDFKHFFGNRILVKHRPKMIFWAFDKVICLMDDEKELPKQVDKSKLIILPNPLSFFSDVAFEKKENIILFIARVTKLKGIDVLIKAWSKIKNEVGDWQLHIVGEGKDKNFAIDLSKKLNLKKITFTAGTKMPKPYYEKSKIVVLPSIIEGFSQTITEAMASKNVVICTKTFGGKYLINDNETGLLFDIGDENELAKKIKYLIKNKKEQKRIVENAHKYIERYKIKNIAQKWQKILI